MNAGTQGDWARYWRADGQPIEAMYAHFSSHVYHRHSHDGYSFGTSTPLEQHEQLTGTVARLTRHAVFRAREVGPSGHVTSSSAAQAAARMRNLLHDCYASPLTADDLAGAAECSRYAAYRAFSARFGLAPSAYQRQLRLRAARRLLGLGVPAAEAAAQVGFADQAHLTRWFRRVYGVTPGAYSQAAR